MCETYTLDTLLVIERDAGVQTASEVTWQSWYLRSFRDITLLAVGYSLCDLYCALKYNQLNLSHGLQQLNATVSIEHYRSTSLKSSSNSSLCICGVSKARCDHRQQPSHSSVLNN